MNKGIFFITSTGFSGETAYKQFEDIAKSMNLKRAVVITTAAPGKENNQYSQLAFSQLQSMGFQKVDFYDFESDKQKDLTEYDVFYVCGGNTFKLMKFAIEVNLGESIKNLVERGGAYVGVSAGSLIIGPSIKIANEINPDNNDIGLKNFGGFNMVDFIVFPHYDEKYEKEIKEFEVNNKYNVKRLKNGEVIIVEVKNYKNYLDFKKNIKSIEDCLEDEIGTKGANLKIISDIKGVKILKTLCVSTKIFKKIMLDGANYSNFKLPGELSFEIMENIKKYFGDRRLVVRSSATCEDSPFLSFAGNYSSFLNIKGKRQILKAVKECYLSIFNKNSELYAKLFGIKIKDHAMAILIQGVAPVITSGVMFTRNPAGKENEIVVEYSDGLGDGVVGGAVKPKIKIVNFKNKKSQPKFILELIILGKKIEKKFNRPQDIEWGVTKNNEIIFFQSRPITAFKNKKLSGDTRDKKRVKIIKKGIGASSGIASGTLIRIIRKNQPLELNEDSILYFDKIVDLHFLQYLSKVKGLIISGGILSHIAVIARELKIPLVANVDSINIKNKSTVTINGDIGLIYYESK